MYLSTLRSYVEAVGGKFELTIKLPQGPALRIHHLGEGGVGPQKSARRPCGRTQIGGGRGR